MKSKQLDLRTRVITMSETQPLKITENEWTPHPFAQKIDEKRQVSYHLTVRTKNGTDECIVYAVQKRLGGKIPLYAAGYRCNRSQLAKFINLVRDEMADKSGDDDSWDNIATKVLSNMDAIPA